MKNLEKWRGIPSFIQKIVRVMKISVFLVLVCTLQLSASVMLGQQVSLQSGEMSVRQVFKELKTQTGTFFMYSEEEVDRDLLVDVDFSDVSLEVALNEICEQAHLDYEIVDDYVLITKKAPVIIKEVEQEKKELKGTVRDEDGNTLPGVSVVVKGTTNGAATDIDGNYTIDIEGSNAVLVFSFVGMMSREITYNGQVNQNVILKADSEQMAEVVVTGYQSIDAYKSTSSVATIKSEDLDLVGALSVDNMLDGKVTGLVTMNTSGTVGAAPKIRIRGTSTISGSREPVWVIDGLIYENPVPIRAEEINSLDNVNLIGNAISGLNPEDIARIDVLKDASATAIYGVKAANGVIVITTKKGKKGRAVTTYTGNVQVGLRPLTSQMNLMNSKERIDVSKEIHAKGLQMSQFPSRIGYEGALLDLYDKKITAAQFDQRVRASEAMNTDWFDLLFRNSVSHNHNVSISGGSDKTTYYFSGGYNKTDGVERNTGVETYKGLMKLSTEFSPRLQLDLKLGGNFSKRKYNHSSLNLFDYAYHTSRALPVEENGNRVFYDKYGDNAYYKYNVLNELDNTGREITTKGIDFSANLKYQFLPGITYTGTYGVNTVNTRIEKYAEEESFYIADMRKSNFGVEPDPENTIVPYGGEYNANHTDALSYTLRNQFTIAKQLNENHNLSVILGSEIRSVRYKSYESTKLGYLPKRGLTFSYIDPAVYKGYANWLKGNKQLKLSDKLTNTSSFYGAFTYDFNHKYVLNFNLRADGSNSFGQDSNDKFLPVWSVSGKWNMTEENFLADSKFIDLLALRASYGVQGNVIDTENPNLIIKPGATNGITGEYESTLRSLPNPNLRWEKTVSYNLGLDYALLNNRLSGSFNYYMKKGEDLLTFRSISSVNGKSTVATNGTDMENYGWEMSLSAVLLKNRDWRWTTSFNMAQNKNKITKVLVDERASNPYDKYLNGTLIREGFSTDDFYAYRYRGLDARGYPTFNGLEVADNSSLSEGEYYAQVLKFMGSRVPKVSGGFVSTVEYKNFSLSTAFSFSFGAKKRLSRYYESSGQLLPTSEQNMTSDFVNRWRKPGDEVFTNVPALSSNPLRLVDVRASIPDDREVYAPYLVGNNLWQMYDDSDLRVVKSDFLRLRTLTLNYKFSKEFVKNLGFHSASVRFQAQNLFVIASKKLNGIDPEQNGEASLPITKSFNLGVNVTF